LLDPHGAVGYGALKKYLDQHPGQKGLLLETAHPVKFYDVVEPIINQPVPMPDGVKGILGKEKKSIQIDVKYEALENYLLMKQ
jgi:threonine synthase